MKQLVLVGGGHAHLHVLRELAKRPIPGCEVRLISPEPVQLYSGMVPGYLQGTYADAQLGFDLQALCQRANVRFLLGAVEQVDTRRQMVIVGREQVPYDYLSLDVGSTSKGLDVPGARDFALSVRPIGRALALRERAIALCDSPRAGQPLAIAVVGGGAAGVELAFALERLCRSRGVIPQASLVEAGPTLLAGYPAGARARIGPMLAARGIRVALGSAVTDVGSEAVTLASGERLASTLTVWLAGAAPQPLLAASAWPRDAAGFLLVDDTLRAVDGSPVWGAGDCVGLQGFPHTPKAGVYAVREAPVLAHNLRAAIANQRPRRYTPQASYLSLLNTADGRALLSFHGFVTHSRWAWGLKDAIDRRFVRTYQEETP